MGKYIRDILLYKTTQKLEIYSKDEIEKIKVLSENNSNDTLIKLISNLSELENSMKWGTQKTIIFETGILKNCIELDNCSLEERVEKLEEEIKAGVVKPRKAQEKSAVRQEKKAQEKNVIKKVEQPEVTGEYVGYWQGVVDELKNKKKIILYTNLINTKAKEAGDTLNVEFKNGITAFGKTVLTKRENVKEITNILEQVRGKNLKINYIEASENFVQKENTNNLEGLDIKINIIEE